DGIQVGADDDARASGAVRAVSPGGAVSPDGAAGIAPPAPLVAGPVDGQGPPALGAGRGEPFAQRQVGGGPGEAPVPAGGGPPDGLELAPQPVELGRADRQRRSGFGAGAG